MNYKLLFNTAVLAGEIMLKNGAETHRVEDTIRRILKVSELKIVESFVTTTGIFATLDDDCINTITSVKRVNVIDTNLNKISMVNEISRDFCNKKIDLTQAYQKLIQLDTISGYSKYQIFIFTALTPLFFALVFSNTISIYELIISLFCGIILSATQCILNNYKVIKFFNNLICSILVAIIAYIFINILKFGTNVELVIISSIMPLVPGVAITNAIRDTLYGDYLSGIARAAEAFITAVSIALGVGCGLALFKQISLFFI